jgi:hypothetical protein
MISQLGGDFFSTGGENYWKSEESRVLCLQKKIRILILFLANDGGRSSMVELQIVVLVVAGSSPVGHPRVRVPLAFRAILGFWNSIQSARLHLNRPLLQNQTGQCRTSTFERRCTCRVTE